MQKVSFLLFLLFSITVSSETVLLKSGKQISGRIIGSDSLTVQIRDSQGIVISIRKDRVEGILSDDPVVPSVKEPSVVPEKKRESIVELAERLRISRKGNSRQYTLGDLANTPELSHFSEQDTQGYSVTEPKFERKEFWKQKSLQLRKEIFVLQEKKLLAEEKCEKAKAQNEERRIKPHSRPQDLASLYELPVECKRMQQIEGQLQHALQRWEELETAARQASVPLSWLD